MFDYNIEYRRNVLFIRFIGHLNKSNISKINKELDNIIYHIGISNIVFNFEELEDIDSVSVNSLINWYNLIKKRKGVSFVCGLKGSVKKSKLLSYMQEISNELCAIRVINWKN